MTLRLPESYRAYRTDTAVSTAVDHILHEEQLSLPASIEWGCLPAFHRAVLSAHQVRCEYAIFHLEFWDAVWKPALECAFGSTLKSLNVTESQDLSGGLDTNTIWAEAWFGRSFKLAPTGSFFQFGEYVDPEDDKGVMLTIAHFDAKKNQCTDRLEINDDKWPEGNIEYETRWSKTFAGIQDSEIDLAPLRKAADAALNAIKSAHAGDG